MVSTDTFMNVEEYSLAVFLFNVPLEDLGDVVFVELAIDDGEGF